MSGADSAGKFVPFSPLAQTAAGGTDTTRLVTRDMRP
jgi:hypothetical protein